MDCVLKRNYRPVEEMHRAKFRVGPLYQPQSIPHCSMSLSRYHVEVLLTEIAPLYHVGYVLGGFQVYNLLNFPAALLKIPTGYLGRNYFVFFFFKYNFQCCDSETTYCQKPQAVEKRQAWEMFGSANTSPTDLVPLRAVDCRGTLLPDEEEVGLCNN